MTTFVALYRGPSIASARLVAVSADPILTNALASRLLAQQDPGPDSGALDPVLDRLDRGRRAALRLIRRETAGLASGEARQLGPLLGKAPDKTPVIERAAAGARPRRSIRREGEQNGQAESTPTAWARPDG